MTKNKNAYDYPHVGCYIDESAGSAGRLNKRVINFAENYGFEINEEVPDEEDEDYSEIISEICDDALIYLNELENRSFMYWVIEDNSLYLMASVENAKEDVGFVSSKTQDYPDDDYRGEWPHITDHGNATLYVRGEDGKDKEIWSVV